MIIGLSLIVVSASSILIYTNLTEKIDYLDDKRIPTIVEGTTLMVDTEKYFTYNKLNTFSARVEVQCDDSTALEVSIGYKSPKKSLMDASQNNKEVLLWDGPHKTKSQSFNDKASKKYIRKEWDLLAKGFTKNEYLKADERIYYLRIIDQRPGPYGYEQNITKTHEGEEIIVPDFQPRMNYLKRFELRLNDLVFETQLYPFFDGSQEIVIPIRGVSHELASRQDLLTFSETRHKANALTNTWSTMKPPSGSDFWAIVFATSKFPKLNPFTFGDLTITPYIARCFIMGSEFNQHFSTSMPIQFENGLFDYGWNIAFCMDGNSSQTDMSTCELTDESHLHNMFNLVNDQLESGDYLISHVISHGISVFWPDFGKHKTLTGHSMLRIYPGSYFCYTDVMSLSDYESKYSLITSRGIKILSFISACHGNGLDSFSSSVHHNKLESWSWRPKGKLTPIIIGSHMMYYEFVWNYDLTKYDKKGIFEPNSCYAILFYRAGNVMGTCISAIGEEIQYEYNYNWFYGDTETHMYIQDTIPNDIFFINWGY
jgi:hypothetical protein